MKRFILLAIVALGFYSCTDSMDNGSPQSCGSVRNVAYEGFNYCGQLKVSPTKPVYVIVNSAEDFQKQFTTCETFAVTFPDFTKKRILGLFSGPKPTSGYTIKIQSVLENDCQILVEYFETAPGDDANVATVISYPADYIVLPKSDKPISFTKVNKIVDYAIVGTYNGQCVGDCNQFYKIENYKVLQYLKTKTFPAEFNQTNYKTLIFKDDLAGFVTKVPTVIKDLKGQTKTFGSPDTHDQGGVYFEWSQAGIVTKIFLDTDNTTDQTPEIIAFKKVIQDKITELKTKS
jgi:hypothetical protein